MILASFLPMRTSIAVTTMMKGNNNETNFFLTKSREISKGILEQKKDLELHKQFCIKKNYTSNNKKSPNSSNQRSVMMVTTDLQITFVNFYPRPSKFCQMLKNGRLMTSDYFEEMPNVSIVVEVFIRGHLVLFMWLVSNVVVE